LTVEIAVKTPLCGPAKSPLADDSGFSFPLRGVR
jgi:hypothetical protein